MGLFGPSKAETQTKETLLEAYTKITEALNKTRSDPFDAIVIFFNATSKLQDNMDVVNAVLNKSIPKKDEAGQNALKFLREEIHKSGRDIYGMNRTKPGETVNIENVYLGNISGLWTFTIREWINHGNKDKGSFKIIQNQASKFVSGYKELPQTIKKLLMYLKVQV
ncbi:MAG: hypothetical protein ACP5OA_05720 [Candidatus Woesearchaeota archaeon]